MAHLSLHAFLPFQTSTRLFATDLQGVRTSSAGVHVTLNSWSKMRKEILPFIDDRAAEFYRRTASNTKRLDWIFWPRSVGWAQKYWHPQTTFPQMVSVRIQKQCLGRPERTSRHNLLFPATFTILNWSAKRRDNDLGVDKRWNGRAEVLVGSAGSRGDPLARPSASPRQLRAPSDPNTSNAMELRLRLRCLMPL